MSYTILKSTAIGTLMGAGASASIIGLLAYLNPHNAITDGVSLLLWNYLFPAGVVIGCMSGLAHGFFEQDEEEREERALLANENYNVNNNHAGFFYVGIPSPEKSEVVLDLAPQMA
ncbi:MAG: hypothetical protein SFW66_06350 [Gammaproteobacteria bacterium]|nr:hypothetical protein [Gammaproteobacteria bacterium]